MAEADEEAVALAINTVRLFLAQPKVKPSEVVALGKALYVLEMMPEVTEGACCSFGVTYRAGDRDFSEMRYIDFSLSDSLFHLSAGGSVYNRDVGSDSYSEPGWRIEVGQRHNNYDCYLPNVEDQIIGCVNLGGKINASDESNFEMDEE